MPAQHPLNILLTPTNHKSHIHPHLLTTFAARPIAGLTPYSQSTDPYLRPPEGPQEGGRARYRHKSATA